jgi:hypothetical protein
MRQKKYFFYLLLIPFLFWCCTEISDVEDSPIKTDDDNQAIPVIPDSIITRANDFVISKVGEQFFNSYIKYDPEKSMYSSADSFCIEHPSSCAEFLLKPHYNFVYNFKIPGKDYVDEIIEFVTDTNGNVVPSREVFGIPKCTGNDCRENFTLIGKDEAVTIAKDNGLEEGIRDWEVSFHFYGGEFDNYVWEVSNTLYQSSSGSGGNTFLIGAGDGEIVRFANWETLP